MSWRLSDIAAKRAELAPERIAFEEVGSGETLPYRALGERAARGAAWLSAQGVGRGDRVAVVCRPRAEAFELLFACAKIGAILAPLDRRMPAPELRGLFEDCAPALVLHDSGGGGAAEACGAQALSLVEYAARRDAEPARPGRDWWPADEPWFLIYTSGTTGAPKGVINTYGMAMANFVNIGQALSLTERDSTLAHLPVCHSAGISLLALPVLMAGGRVLTASEFDPGEALRLLAEGRISAMFSVPAAYRAIAEQPEFGGADLSRVRSWSSGGAPMPPSLHVRYAERGAVIRHGYGLSESGPTTLLADIETARGKPGTAGRPQLLTRARVVDDSGRDAAPGETGEIWLSGPGVTPGYWRRPDETRQILTEDGWLKTGDLGQRDADGDFFIVGRIKEMILSGGANIYPAEIEAVLARHPDVAEAAVIGAPDPAWGEACHAFVEPRPGRAPSRAELDAFCRRRLAGYKVPKTFTLIDALPRTPSGKVQKARLDAPAPQSA